MITVSSFTSDKIILNSNAFFTENTNNLFKLYVL